VSFAAINLCVASQRVFIVVVYFVIDSVRNLLDTPSYFTLLDYLMTMYQLLKLCSIDCGEFIRIREAAIVAYFKPLSCICME
jgi:hypothetical protein